MRDIDPSLPTGILTIRVYLNGDLVEESSGRNLVLDARRKINARLLGGTDDPVSRVGFGTGAAPPVPGNVSLYNSVTKDIDSVSYPSDSQVQFAFTLGLNDANGKAISEFGLLTTSGILFARKVRGAPLNKTDQMSISGFWKITY